MSMEEIVEALELHRSTVFRILGDLRQQLGVCIDHDATADGYRITDWGAINSRRI